VKKETLVNVGLGVLVLCALYVTGTLVQQQFFPASASARTPPEGAVTKVADWRAYAVAGQRLGAPDGAPVSIVVFSDYQCPACAILSDQLRTLQREYPREVQVVYRHYPLRTHPFARDAAEASECASKQGRFGAFHDALFTGQDAIGTLPWTRFAEMARIPDVAAFEQCLADDRQMAAVERDAGEGRRLGLKGTPTVLVNDVRLDGVYPIEFLRTYVDQQIAAADGRARR
jgi:protein-disulfide isomerase